MCVHTGASAGVSMIVPSPYFLLSPSFININISHFNHVQVDIHFIYLKHEFPMYSVKPKQVATFDVKDTENALLKAYTSLDHESCFLLSEQ